MYNNKVILKAVDKNIKICYIIFIKLKIKELWEDMKLVILWLFVILGLFLGYLIEKERKRIKNEKDIGK